LASLEANYDVSGLTSDTSEALKEITRHQFVRTVPERLKLIGGFATSAY